MGQSHKHSTLKRTYYRSFLILVVIPLVLVFLVAEVLIGYILRNSAIETIDALQETVSIALADDVRNSALQLSHFIYANDGEFTRTAVTVHHSSGSEWYLADQQLQRAFHTAMVPSQDILAGAFYMKEAGAVYMKDDVAIPQEEVRSAPWYQKALEQPNRITLGCYDTSRTQLFWTSQQNRQLVLVTAMATNQTTDKSQEIETAVFFTKSQAGDILRAQYKNQEQGMSVILNGDGNVLFGDMGNDVIREFFDRNSGRFTRGSQTIRAHLLENGERDYFFRTRFIPDTDWAIVTFVEEPALLSGFLRLGSILLLIVAVLLTLFYFYSRYFLNAIIDPVQAVCQGMERLDQNDLEVQVEPTGQWEIRELMASFNEMVLSIRNMLRVTEETMEKKHEAEIQALQSQINPHFIVNTLNSIRLMAQVAKYDGIRKMAEALVSIVSCSFRSNVSFYTVQDELDMLETYVYLMRIRYSNGFEVRYHIQPDCLRYRLPRLTLQPILENAITHGFDELTEELGQIEVSVYCQGEFLCLSVWDNGRGMSPEEIRLVLGARHRKKGDNTSIGLENVQARIKLNFGESARLEIDSEPGTFTRVTLRLPLAGCTLAEKEERHDSNADRG